MQSLSFILIYMYYVFVFFICIEVHALIFSADNGMNDLITKLNGITASYNEDSLKLFVSMLFSLHNC